MHAGLNNRPRSDTGLDFAKAIFECVEGFRNHARSHCAFGWKTRPQSERDHWIQTADSGRA